MDGNCVLNFAGFIDSHFVYQETDKPEIDLEIFKSGKRNSKRPGYNLKIIQE